MQGGYIALEIPAGYTHNDLIMCVSDQDFILHADKTGVNDAVCLVSVKT